MRALYTAATGMMAQELNVEVISNNVANMRTTGFKRQRAEFQDLLYKDVRRVGVATSDSGTQVPTGIQVGSGVKTAGTPRIHSQGTIIQTEKLTDMAIRGEGYYRITLPDGATAYTRDGSFELDSEGRIVTVDGYIFDDGFTVPNDATSLSINNAGIISVNIPGQTDPVQIGTVQLARFVNKSGLESIGDNLFLETSASGPAIIATPQTDGMGNILQGYLEEANVNAVTEIAALIAAQRAYEMNARVIRSADEMLSSTSQV